MVSIQKPPEFFIRQRGSPISLQRDKDPLMARTIVDRELLLVAFRHLCDQLGWESVLSFPIALATHYPLSLIVSQR
ncbi:hypothetical protein CCR75_000809 [Bremia lactucae]|uniref:Uncharacterized protein n=1 Tax=Bremia lactucae TaxID=4779 RepID=A0A976IHN0_BRELC|nr:hypothetical protein CCR75_000809 [Bremia lactucae]